MSDSLWPHGLLPTKLLCPCNSPGKNTRVGCHFLLLRIFPSKGSNPALLHCRLMLYHLSHQGSRRMLKGGVRKWWLTEKEYKRTFCDDGAVISLSLFFFLLVKPCIMWNFSFPTDQGSIWCPLQWKHRALTTDLQGIPSVTYPEYCDDDMSVCVVCVLSCSVVSNSLWPHGL